MTTEEMLIDFFSRRRVHLTPTNARYVIKLVKEDIRKDEALVTLHKHIIKNGIKSYEELRTFKTSFGRMLHVMQLEIPDVKEFYKFTLYNPDGEKLGEVYTVNSELFKPIQ